jgi:hypothetical protein
MKKRQFILWCTALLLPAIPCHMMAKNPTSFLTQDDGGEETMEDEDDYPEEPINIPNHKSPARSAYFLSYNDVNQTLQVHFRKSIAKAKILILHDSTPIIQDRLTNIQAGTSIPYSIYGYGAGTYSIILAADKKIQLLGNINVE